MTKRVLSVVAVAAILALFTPLSVTTSAAEMNCRVPFSFIVSGKTLPPGYYSLTTRDAVLFLSGIRGGAIALTNNAQSPTEKGVKAVFLKVGDRYELIEVWTGDGAGREIPLSRKHVEDRARAANSPVERIVIAGT